MEEIVVRINPVMDIPHVPMIDIFSEIFILAILRNNGIPIKGTLIFQGLEKGMLYRYDDQETKEIVFTWKG